MMEDFWEEFEETETNPNLFVWMPSAGGIWSSNTYPWQETNPWTLVAAS